MTTRLLFLILTFILATGSCFSQGQLDSSYVLKFTQEQKDLIRYIGPGEMVHYQVYSDSSRRHYTGIISEITPNEVVFGDTTFPLEDIEMMLSPQYRHARHTQLGIGIFAGALLTGVGTTLIIVGESQHKLVGAGGIIIGLPLLYKSVRGYLISNHYKMKNGWKMEVLPFYTGPKPSEQVPE